MGILKPMGDKQGFLKAGFLGFAKSGKTYTATELACFTREFMGLKKPIAFFDTESGSGYIAQKVKDLTGKDMIGIRSRTFDDLLEATKESIKAASVLIIDSITHPWRELCQSYLDRINEQRRKKGMNPRVRLSFPDWNVIKPRWQEWTELYLSSPLHIIMCGRAGWEYEFQEEEDNPNRMELIKTGVKMKTEVETGFEPGLLVEMQRIQNMETHQFVHKALVLGDRFGVMDGATCDNPSPEFFKPHLEMLKGGKAIDITAGKKSEFEVNDDGDASYYHQKRQKEVLIEKITNVFVKQEFGRSDKDKKAKIEIVTECFGTDSWKEIESYPLQKLKHGYEKLLNHFNQEEE